MQNTGKVGWLYSVIAPGKVSADAPLELVSRVSDVTVQEAAAIAWHMRLMTISITVYSPPQGYRKAGRERCKSAD
mgnify:CR=1 FL=1